MAKTRSAFGTIEKRETNVYRVRWYDKKGERHSETVKGPKIRAQRRLAEIQLGIYGTGEAVTYRELWSEVVAPTFTTLSDHTVREYERVWSVELEPRIGGDVISTTDWKRVESVLWEIQASSVQHKAFRLWRKMLNIAIREGYIDRNPCDRSIRLRQHVRRRKVLLESQEVLQWMRDIRGLKYEPVLLALCGGGLRPAEAMALEWSDVEPYELGGTVYAKVDVSKVVVPGKDGAYIRESTKNATSTRVVLIGEPWASRLLELRSDGYLCPNRDGKPSLATTAAHNYKNWCDRHGVKHVTFENMRSSYATMHGEAGSVGSLVSFSMGHSDGTTRTNFYQTATLKGLAMIADNLAEYLWSMCPCSKQPKDF